MLTSANFNCVNTGLSGYSKGWSRKSIWTYDVCSLLREVGIKHTFGNNAPRGGASGEYVEITDVRFINRKKKAIAKESAEAEAKVSAAKQVESLRIANFKASLSTMPEFEQIKTSWSDLSLKNESGLSWVDYRDSLKAKYPQGWAALKSAFQNKIRLVDL